MDLLTIEKELSQAFASAEAFERYYLTNLRGKTVNEWKRELERKIFNIHSYLKGALVGTVSSDVVKLWLNRINSWEDQSKSIRYRVNDDYERYNAYSDLPEAIYDEETINNILEQSAKSYQEIEPSLINKIRTRLSLLTELNQFAQANLETLTICNNRIKNIFSTPTKETEIPKASRLQNSNYEVVESPIKEINPPRPILNISQINVLKLYKELSKGFIDSIEENEFKDALNGLGSAQRINWVKQVNQLGYLIKKLKAIQFFDDSAYWEIATQIFTVKGELITSDNLRTNQSNIAKEKRKVIDDLIKTLQH